MEDHRPPLVAFNLWVHAGPRNEAAGQTALPTCFEHLMFAGSKHVPRGQFDKFVVDAAGGTDSNGSTNFDRTNYFFTCPAPTRAGALAQVRHAGLHARRGRRRGPRQPTGRGAQTSAARPPRTSPMAWPTRRCMPRSSPKATYRAAIIGSHADIQSIKLSDVRDFARTYRPNNATLVLAGDFDPPKPRPWSPPSSARSRPAQTARVRVPQPVIKERAASGGHRPHRAAAPSRWPGTPRLCAAGDAELDVVSHVLGGGKASRLGTASGARQAARTERAGGAGLGLRSARCSTSRSSPGPASSTTSRPWSMPDRPPPPSRRPGQWPAPHGPSRQCCSAWRRSRPWPTRQLLQPDGWRPRLCRRRIWPVTAASRPAGERAAALAARPGTRVKPVSPCPAKANCTGGCRRAGATATRKAARRRRHQRRRRLAGLELLPAAAAAKPLARQSVRSCAELANGLTVLRLRSPSRACPGTVSAKAWCQPARPGSPNSSTSPLAGDSTAGMLTEGTTAAPAGNWPTALPQLLGAQLHAEAGAECAHRLNCLRAQVGPAGRFFRCAAASRLPITASGICSRASAWPAPRGAVTAARTARPWPRTSPPVRSDGAVHPTPMRRHPSAPKASLRRWTASLRGLLAGHYRPDRAALVVARATSTRPSCAPWPRATCWRLDGPTTLVLRWRPRRHCPLAAARTVLVHASRRRANGPRRRQPGPPPARQPDTAAISRPSDGLTPSTAAAAGGTRAATHGISPGFQMGPSAAARPLRQCAQRRGGCGVEGHRPRDGGHPQDADGTAELSRVRNAVMLALPGQFDTNAAVVQGYASQWVIGQPIEALRALPAQLGSVNAADALRAARQHLDPPA